MSDIATILHELRGLPGPDLIRLGLWFRGLGVRDAARSVGCSPAQLSNALAGRRRLAPATESALLYLLGLQPLLVARLVEPFAQGHRLLCDGVTLHGRSAHLALEVAAERLYASGGWERARPTKRETYSQVHHRSGLRLAWRRSDPAQAEVRLEFKPNSLRDQGRADVRSLVSVPTASWMVARVDVAADYPVPRHGIELLGVATKTGMVIHERVPSHWVVPFEVRASRIASGRRSSRVGSARSEGHVRCYAHPVKQARDGVSFVTRTEAQLRPCSAERLRVQDLPDLPDPFEAVEVVVLDPRGLEYPWTSVLRDIGLYGSSYVRSRLSAAGWKDLLEWLGAAERPTFHPTPSELFRSEWRTVATAFLADLGVLAEAEP